MLACAERQWPLDQRGTQPAHHPSLMLCMQVGAVAHVLGHAQEPAEGRGTGGCGEPAVCAGRRGGTAWPSASLRPRACAGQEGSQAPEGGPTAEARGLGPVSCTSLHTGVAFPALGSRVHLRDQCQTAALAV